MAPTSRSHIPRKELVSAFILFLVIAYLVYSLLVYAIHGDRTGNSFFLLGNARILPTYSDLKWLTVVAECGTRTETLSVDNPLCTAYGYGTNHGGFPASGYPPFINWVLRFVHFPVQSTGLFGLISGLSFIGVLTYWSRKLFESTFLWSICLSFCLLSFPVQLLLERGNLDSILFLFMLVAAFLFAQRGALPKALSSVMVFLSVALKIFPAPGFIGWCLFNPLRDTEDASQFRLSTKAPILTACLLGLAVSVPFILHDPPIVFMGGMHSYGLRALGYVNVPLIDYFGIDVARWIIRSLILLKGMSLVVGAALVYHCRLDLGFWNGIASIHESSFRSFTHSLVSIMSWTWFIGYIITISYDYKYIFLLPAFLTLVSALEESDWQLTGKQKQVIYFLLASSLWVVLIPVGYNIFSNKFALLFNFAEVIMEVFILPVIAGGVAIILFGQIIRVIPLRDGG
jgi:hypothetical protein